MSLNYEITAQGQARIVVCDIPIAALGISQAIRSQWGSSTEILTPGSYTEAVSILTASDCRFIISDIAYKQEPVEKLINALANANLHPPLLLFSSHTFCRLRHNQLARGQIVTVSKKEGLGAMIGAASKLSRTTFEQSQASCNFEYEPLSQRELQVLKSHASGLTIKEIAAALDVSHKTVSTERERVYQKLRIQSLAEAVRYCINLGLI